MLLDYNPHRDLFFLRVPRVEADPRALMKEKVCAACGEKDDGTNFYQSSWSYCKECTRKRNREQYAANKEQYKRRARNAELKRLYGITLDQYEEMLAAQDYKCAVCGGNSKWGKLSVDHNHNTGKVRGLLCEKCNRAIGLLNDNAELAYKLGEYLA